MTDALQVGGSAGQEILSLATALSVLLESRINQREEVGSTERFLHPVAASLCAVCQHADLHFSA